VGRILDAGRKEAVICLLERMVQDPLRQRLAQELLGKLLSEPEWRPAAAATEASAKPPSQRPAPPKAPTAPTPATTPTKTTTTTTTTTNNRATASGRSASVSAALASKPNLRGISVDRRRRLPGASPEPRHLPTQPCSGEDVITVNFCVPRSRHHLVVGKGGETISKLKSQFGVEIRVPRLDAEVPEEEEAQRLDCVAVSGRAADVESCRAALECLLCLPVGTEALHVMRLGVPRARHGVLIGEKGATLHQLMAECRVLVQVPPRTSTEDAVVVRGRPEDCLRAKAAIEAMLKDTVPVLTSEIGAGPSMPLPPSYDLAAPVPIRRTLWFPDLSGPERGATMPVRANASSAASQPQ
ncbi:unnamed protein product, partial [Polarella glacialis]